MKATKQGFKKWNTVFRKDTKGCWSSSMGVRGKTGNDK